MRRSARRRVVAVAIGALCGADAGLGVVVQRRRLRLPCPSYISFGAVIARLVVPRRWRERLLSGNLRVKVIDHSWPTVLIQRDDL